MAFVTTVSAICVLLLPAERVTGQQTNPDPWEPIRFLVGDWEGRAEGQAGNGTVRRTYAFVLEDRYLHEKNVSTYPPQEANKTGEVHEHWSFFSYDRGRKTLVLRQFHQEGFVNQYALNTAESRRGKLVFDTERFENFDNGWRGRETYEIRSVDEFVETFELGAPGKTLQVYSRNHFMRAKRQPRLGGPHVDVRYVTSTQRVQPRASGAFGFPTRDVAVR
ncbi:MAG: hypothetical protein ACRD1S_00265 [Vicinamibacterales bacterium]